MITARRLVSDGCKKGGLVGSSKSSVTWWEPASNDESSVSLSM